MKSVKALIFDFIANRVLKDNDFDLKYDSNLIGQGLIDSYGIIQIISYVESELSIQLDQDDINTDNFSSINAIAKLLDRYE